AAEAPDDELPAIRGEADWVGVDRIRLDQVDPAGLVLQPEVGGDLAVGLGVDGASILTEACAIPAEEERASAGRGSEERGRIELGPADMTDHAGRGSPGPGDGAHARSTNDDGQNGPGREGRNQSLLPVDDHLTVVVAASVVVAGESGEVQVGQV